MTGYTVHTGSTEKFSTNWDQIFAGKQAKAAGGSPKTPAKSAKKASNKKSARKS